MQYEQRCVEWIADRVNDVCVVCQNAGRHHRRPTDLLQAAATESIHDRSCSLAVFFVLFTHFALAAHPLWLAWQVFLVQKPACYLAEFCDSVFSRGIIGRQLLEIGNGAPDLLLSTIPIWFVQCLNIYLPELAYYPRT
jgi:hypothetical protein